MANELKIFNSPEFGEVRVIGTSEEPLFCLKDVCNVLGLHRNVVVQRLEDWVCSTYPTPDSLGRMRDTIFVNEDGLYDVILDSRKPEAKKFRKWVTSEVLPSIRKDGGYMIAPVSETPEETMARALIIAQKAMADKERRLQAATQQNQILEGEVSHLQKENDILLPKAQYTDEVLQSTTTYTFTQIAKELDFRSVNAFISQLRSLKILYKQSGQYMLSSRFADRGYVTSRTYKYYHKDGSPGTSTSTVITEKGRAWFHTLRKAGRI